MARRDRWPDLGPAALVVAAGGLVTGLFLALHYAPTLDAARASIAHLEAEVALGAFLRSLHHWTGSFALVLALLHGARVFWTGGYKRPRHVVWLYGGGLFLVLLGFAYTGYLLPGDERAFTGLGVMESVAGATPLVGDRLGALVRGGPFVSSTTLVRVYVAHVVVLPAALAGLLYAFLRARRRAGEATVRPGPLLLGGVLAALAVCAWAFPPGLGPAPDVAGGGAADARPEWFFLWVNELLRRAPGATFLLGALLPGLLAALGLLLPFLARGEERRPARRKPEIAAAAAILLGIGALTALSLARTPEAAAPEEPAAPAADAGFEERVATVLKSFRCAKCHTIDGDEEGGATGPPLDRATLGELYTRRFFREKVGDPLGFWPDTGMVYKPRSKKPTPGELDLLERWFFDAK